MVNHQKQPQLWSVSIHTWSVQVPMVMVDGGSAFQITVCRLFRSLTQEEIKVINILVGLGL